MERIARIKPEPSPKADYKAKRAEGPRVSDDAIDRIRAYHQRVEEEQEPTGLELALARVRCSYIR